MFRLIDYVPLNMPELAEQRLTYRLSINDHPTLRESLLFAVLERQSALLSLLSEGSKHE